MNKIIRIRRKKRRSPMVLPINKFSEVLSPNSFTSQELTYINFGKHEVNEAAKILWRFFCSKDCWDSFTFTELDHFCEQCNIRIGMALFGLICGWVDDGGFGSLRRPNNCIIQISIDEFAITNVFIRHLTLAQKEAHAARA